MPTDTTGPAPIDQLSTGIRVGLGSRLARRDWLVEKFAATHARVATITGIATGEWYTEWPDLSVSPEAPTVANIVEIGIAHWSSLFGAMLPSIRVPIHATSDRQQGKRGARKRERRVRELWKRCNLSESSAQFGADYAGAGYAVGLVWANFGEPDPAKRDPFIMRLDPRHVFLTKDNLGNITELLVARKISLKELQSMWKGSNDDYLAVFSESKDEDIEEWFWIDHARILYAIVDIGKKNSKTRGERHVVLTDVPNELYCVPAWEATRPTFDGQRRGHFDQTIHILRTMHRLMLMTIRSTEEHSYPAIAGFDVANPEDFGPGAYLQLLSPEAKIDRLGPSAHFDVKDLIGRLGEEARTQGALPQQLFGEPGASIVSARGINAAMGALDARLAVAHKQMETMFSKLSGFMLMMDEKYCDGEKTILGDGTDDEAAETFIPSRDINGAWLVECTYGLSAGSDPANAETRLHMHLSGRLISRETARNELFFLEDPEGEPLKMFREAMQDALVTGIMARAQDVADPTLAAQALKLMQKDDIDFENVLDELVDFIAAPDPAAQAPGIPTEMGGAAGAAGAAESLARGGIPGNADQGPQLPPLSQVMNSPTQVL